MENYDELLKAKELLDNGVIDEQEYNAIKKKLLGLDVQAAPVAAATTATEAPVEVKPVAPTTEPIKTEESTTITFADTAPSSPIETGFKKKTIASTTNEPIIEFDPISTDGFEEKSESKKTDKKKWLIGGAIGGVVIIALIILLATGVFSGGNSSDEPIVGEWSADYVFSNGNATDVYSGITLEVTGKRWTLNEYGTESSGKWSLDSTGNLSDGSEYRLYKFESDGSYKLISYYVSNDVLMINPAQSVDASNFTSFKRQ